MLRGFLFAPIIYLYVTSYVTVFGIMLFRLMELIDIDAPIKKKAKKTSELGSIQMLRAIAAIMVAFAHLHAVEAKLGGPILFGTWSLAGFSGVDIFFVISGFIMVWTNKKNHGQIAKIPRFWFLRIARIYPIWLLVCGAIYAVWLVHPNWVYQSHHSNPDILKSFLLLPQQALPLHAVGWTLVHELWFYLVFGFLLLIPSRYFAIGISIWASILLFLAIIGFDTQSPELRLITHPLGLEFICGAIVGLIAKKVPTKFGKPILSTGLMLMIAGFIHATPTANDFFARTTDRVIWFAIPFALIVLGLVKIEENEWKAPKNLVRIGNYSYALYLIHVPVFAAIGRLMARFSNPNSLADNIVFCIISLIVALIASAILHILFERPIMKMAHKLMPARQ